MRSDALYKLRFEISYLPCYHAHELRDSAALVVESCHLHDEYRHHAVKVAAQCGWDNAKPFLDGKGYARRHASYYQDIAIANDTTEMPSKIRYRQ